MELIENQPIVFNQGEPDCSPIIFNQLVDVADSNQFQLILEPCGDAVNTVSNGAFNDSTDWILAGFSISNNQACALGGTNAAIYQTGVVEDGKYYQVNFTVDSGTDISLNIYLGTNHLIGSVTSAGTYSICGFGVVDTLLIFLSQAPGTVCISNVSVLELKLNFGFGIKNNVGQINFSKWLKDYVYPIDTGSGTTDYQVISDYFTLVNGYLTAKIIWGDFEIQDPGCYRICLFDPCTNHDFNLLLCDESNWDDTVFGGATFEFQQNLSDKKECVVYFEDNPGGGFVFLENLIANNFVPGTTYTITFTLSTMTDAEIYFRMGSIDTIAYTANGTYQVNIIPDADSFFIIFATTGGGLCRATVSDLYIHVANEYLSSTTCSYPLKLGDYSGTQLINACNDTDAFGFLFEGTGFSPSVRLESSLDRAQYDSNRVTESNSNARIRNTFYQRTKKKRLAIEAIPEYLHNFVSLLFGFDHFYIDQIEYVVSEDEEYVVSYDVDDFKGSVAFNVTVKEQLIRNAVTSAEGDGCNVVGNPGGLVDEETGLYDLSEEMNTNEELIEENG